MVHPRGACLPRAPGAAEATAIAKQPPAWAIQHAALADVERAGGINAHRVCCHVNCARLSGARGSVGACAGPCSRRALRTAIVPPCIVRACATPNCSSHSSSLQARVEFTIRSTKSGNTHRGGEPGQVSTLGEVTAHVAFSLPWSHSTLLRGPRAGTACASHAAHSTAPSSAICAQASIAMKSGADACSCGGRWIGRGLAFRLGMIGTVACSGHTRHLPRQLQPPCVWHTA